MTIHLPESVESSLRDAVLCGRFASMDDAMSEAARLLLERLESPPVDAPAEESAFEVLERAGAIGRIKAEDDSPTDLSTNPAHMEGFGRA